jgi:glycosyltransferase involved in cell wall biosynthesis
MPRLTPPILSLPESAGGLLRERLGLAETEALRITYIPGPGDIRTTYDWWKKGDFDPRVPSIAYSTMFFELCAALGNVTAQIVIRSDRPAPPFVEEGFRFDTAAYRHANGRIGYFLARLRYVSGCLLAMRRFKPHIAVVASDFDWQYLPLAGLFAGKVILSVHNTRWPMGERTGGRATLKDRLYGEALKTAPAAVCTSHECERQIRILARRGLWSREKIPPQGASQDQERAPVEPAAAIKTFVAAPQQVALPEAPPVNPEPERLLYLGRIERPKGVFDLLDAYETLARSKPNLSLVFAGGGGALDDLKAEIAARKLGDRVQAPGHLDSRRAHEELRRTDLLVCPTRTDFNEGLAFVCFEAAGYGVPVVMSSVVPARDLLAGGCIVFKANDTQALAAAIAEAFGNCTYESLRSNARLHGQITLDRSMAWGSQLYRAMAAAAG